MPTAKLQISELFKKLQRAAQYARGEKKNILKILGLTMLIAAAGVTEPLVMKFIFDSLTVDGIAFKQAAWLIALLLGLGIFREAISATSNTLTWRTRLCIHFLLLGETVGRIHRLPFNFHQKEGVGAVMTKLERGVQNFVSAVTEMFFNVFPALLYLAMALVIMFRLDWRMTLTVLALTPVPAIIASIAAPRQVTREKALLEWWGRIYSRFNEVLTGLVTVRSFVMEEYEKQRFLSQVGQANATVAKGIRYDSSINALQNLVTLLARVSAIAVGIFLIVKGQITIGTLIAFLGYVTVLFGPVQSLTSIYRLLQTTSVSLDHIFNILDTQELIGDAPDAINLTEVKGAVSFRNVSFSYPSGKKILSNVDLDVKAGESIAIVGPSGSGKSTMMALLQRFYDPVEGSIFIDGIDIRTIKQESLRRHIGVVLQDPLLFNDTIRSNIGYGKPGASEEEIIEAATAANCNDFIKLLPQGYDTFVGERGGLLSQGERQRIAIARALLKNPPILILDEATSAQDAESEAMIQEALERLTVNRTTFIIAHRLGTVVNADRIIVLKEGKIVESGNHKELMQQNGYYASLVARQTKGLIPH